MAERRAADPGHALRRRRQIVISPPMTLFATITIPRRRRTNVSARA
jgi:hypothetical protein